MVRAIGLSLVFLLGLGAMIPISMNLSEASSKNRVAKRKKKKIKKYSKQWWRIYRARMKKKRALMARKRAFQARREAVARRSSNGESRSRVVGGVNYVQTATSPLGDDTPNGWRNRAVRGSDVEFDVADESGQNIGSASLSVVGAAVNIDEATPPTVRNRTVGGVSTGSLRRTVIDKMLREDGWVVNDFQKEVNGKKVFVVVAQTNSNGTIKQQTYYFTEIDGRIYNLTTNSPVDLSDRLNGDSEKVINALQRSRSGANQTEATLR